MSELSDDVDQHGRRIPFDSPEAQPREVWLAEIEAACNALLLDVYDLSIANVPISPECARQTVDCIGHRVGQIRESAAALATPRANGETTVEAALAELREMFPTFHCRITFCEDVHSDPDERTYCNIEWVDPESGEDWGEIAATLADCMAQVRAARTEGKGGK